jgi:hypothetical protein
MTIVTIKKVNRRTTLSRNVVAKVMARAVAIHGKPKSAVVRVKNISLANPKKQTV